VDSDILELAEVELPGSLHEAGQFLLSKSRQLYRIGIDAPQQLQRPPEISQSQRARREAKQRHQNTAPCQLASASEG
jgi:hypothetical protein